MKEYTIHNFSEYISVLESISIDYQLSRGQADDLPLLPSALRCDTDGKKLYSKSTIRSFLDDFKTNSYQYIENHAIPSSLHEWMVYAQHFGVPTQLLDFTYSHIISLMFAVEKAFNYDEEDIGNAVVWFLNPQKLNEKTIRRTEIVNIASGSDVLETSDGPVTISAPKNNSRISAQNGVFVFFPYESKSLDSSAPADEVLIKIIVPHQACRRLLASLYQLGLRFSNLYPELTSVSKDILLKSKVFEFPRENDCLDGDDQKGRDGCYNG